MMFWGLDDWQLSRQPESSNCRGVRQHRAGPHTHRTYSEGIDGILFVVEQETNEATTALQI